MNNFTSADLQSKLLSLSSLVHEENRPLEAKASKIEEIGNTILEKIYAENSNLSISARLYLEQIASSIVDKKWSDIPKPVEMKFDFQKLKNVASALALAAVSTTIDLFELFRFMMKQKGDEAYNLVMISIMDAKLSLNLDKERFKQQEKSNQIELVSGVVAGVLQGVQGFAQAGSNFKSIYKTGKLGVDTNKAIDMSKETADSKIQLDSDTATRKELTSKYNALENEVTIMKTKDPNNTETISKLEDTKGRLGLEVQTAKETAEASAKTYNDLNADFEKASKLVDQKTNIERFKDQLRSSVINGFKGVFDVGVAFVRFEGAKAKLSADMLEAAKNTTDRSANAMSESGRKASEDVKKLQQFLEGILQMMDASLKKQFS